MPGDPQGGNATLATDANMGGTCWFELQVVRHHIPIIIFGCLVDNIHQICRNFIKIK